MRFYLKTRRILTSNRQSSTNYTKSSQTRVRTHKKYQRPLYKSRRFLAVEIILTDKRASNKLESSSLRRICSKISKKKGKPNENRSFLTWKGPVKIVINGKSSNNMSTINWMKPKRDCKSMKKSNLCVRKTPQRRKITTTRTSNIRRMITGSGLVQLRT